MIQIMEKFQSDEYIYIFVISNIYMIECLSMRLAASSQGFVYGGD